jgi:hypothetical protein
VVQHLGGPLDCTLQDLFYHRISFCFLFSKLLNGYLLLVDEGQFRRSLDESIIRADAWS